VSHAWQDHSQSLVTDALSARHELDSTAFLLCVLGVRCCCYDGGSLAFRAAYAFLRKASRCTACMRHDSFRTEVSSLRSVVVLLSAWLVPMTVSMYCISRQFGLCVWPGSVSRCCQTCCISRPQCSLREAHSSCAVLFVYVLRYCIFVVASATATLRIACSVRCHMSGRCRGRLCCLGVTFAHGDCFMACI
jgi:hypothetical protein